MAGNGVLEKALCAMKSGSSEDITKVFYAEKILSSCELTDRCLSRNYIMESYIPNKVIEKESS